MSAIQRAHKAAIFKIRVPDNTCLFMFILRIIPLQAGLRLISPA
jgi:hypothetical protein